MKKKIFPKPLVRLNSSGLAHFVAPLIIIVLIAVGGTFLLVSSHADSALTIPKCKKGTVLVNALHADFISGRNKNAAKKGHGLICVSDPGSRQKVVNFNANTVNYFFKCPANSTFAYDNNNPDGTGYHNRWILQTTQGGDNDDRDAVKTYYCVKVTNLYKDLTHNGKRVKRVSGMYDTVKNSDRHSYNFHPAYDMRYGCNDDTRLHTDCQAKYLFIYYGDITASSQLTIHVN